LIGCDGIVDTEYLNPSLSTIVQPIKEMCEIAWEFLKNRMANPDIAHQEKVLNAHLSLRGSSNASIKLPLRQAEPDEACGSTSKKARQTR